MSQYSIKQSTETDYIKMADGIERQTLTYGDKTLLCKFRFTQGSALPVHSHPHEQTGYLISGKIILIISGERNEINPGDSWSIKGDVEHEVEVLEDTILVEVFSPVRKEFL